MYLFLQTSFFLFQLFLWFLCSFRSRFVSIDLRVESRDLNNHNRMLSIGEKITEKWISIKQNYSTYSPTYPCSSQNVCWKTRPHDWILQATQYYPLKEVSEFLQFITAKHESLINNNGTCLYVHTRMISPWNNNGTCLYVHTHMISLWLRIALGPRDQDQVQVLFPNLHTYHKEWPSSDSRLK